MPTRNVVLTDHHEQLIATLVASGQYQNASEVLRDGLRMVEHRVSEEAAKLAALRVAAQTGIEDITLGHYVALQDRNALRSHLTAVSTRALRSEGSA